MSYTSSGSVSTPINWSNELIYKLIEMYQDRELLWNVSLDAYRNRIKKHDAWCEISNALGVDKHSAEKKMRSLVGQFQRELRKKDSGSEHPVKWFAFNKLMFLKDRASRSGQYADSGNERNDAMYDDDIDDEPEQEDGCQSPQTITISDHSNLPSSTQPQSIRHPRKRPFLKPIESKRRNIETSFPIKRSQFATPAEINAYSADDSQAFGSFIASKLRQYSRETRNALQHEISNLIYQADRGYFQSASQGFSSRRSDPLSTRSPSMEDNYEYPSLRDFERNPDLQRGEQYKVEVNDSE